MCNTFEKLSWTFPAFGLLHSPVSVQLMRGKPGGFLSALSLPHLLLFSFLTLTSTAISAQAISGHFPELAGQKITLTGFEGMQTYPIAKVETDQEGRFTLPFGKKDHGMGYLAAEDNKAYFVILSGENTELEGGIFAVPESVRCTAGNEQQAFERYATEHPRREQALSAWIYLERMYGADPLFAKANEAKEMIVEEKRRIKSEDKFFVDNLDPDSYVRWFLPTRRLVSSVSTVAQYRPEEIPATIAAFRQLNYSDHRLYKSGLYKDAIESHYWLLENMGKDLDSVFIEMNISTDHLLASLENDEKKFNEITNYLFDLLERHSLFEAAEYLALKALTQGSCTLNDDLAKQLETYRAMKKGNTAPDITFTGDRFRKGLPVTSPTNLSGLNAGHKLIVFGASWCPKCTEEIPEIAKLYDKWKQHDVEVVFISLDDETTAFRNFAKSFPFLSFCDYKKWESPVAKDYYVFATPTMFLLNGEHQVILRPNSVKQVDAWVDWYLGSK